MTYSEFLFTELFRVKFKTDLEYDRLYPIVNEEYIKFSSSNFNTDTRSEYDCVLSYLNYNVDRIRNKLYGSSDLKILGTAVYDHDDRQVILQAFERLTIAGRQLPSGYIFSDPETNLCIEVSDIDHLCRELDGAQYKELLEKIVNSKF